MKWRFTAVLAALAIIFGAAPARGQQLTGEIFGKVTDESGAVLPPARAVLARTGPSRQCSQALHGDGSRAVNP